MKYGERSCLNKEDRKVFQTIIAQEALAIRELKKFEAYATAGDMDNLKSAGLSVLNRCPDGKYYSLTEDGRFKITTLDGTSEIVDMPSHNEIKDMIAEYYNLPAEKKFFLRLFTNKENNEHNWGLTKKVEWWIDENGNIVYRMPAGFVDIVTGERQGAFFFRDIKDQKPIPESETKDFRKLPGPGASEIRGDQTQMSNEERRPR